MKLICLVTIFTLFSSTLCENFVIIGDMPEDGIEALSPTISNNTIPVMSYHEIAAKVKKVAININKFIQIIVDSIRIGGRDIDPIALSDVTETFKDKILFVNIEGQFVMRNGQLHNIKSISRHGNATLRYENLKLIIDTAFIFDKLTFNYDFVSKIESLGPRGYMYGQADGLVVETVFVYDIMKNKLSLNKTSVIDKVPIDVKVQVSVVIDWLANPIISWLSELYESKILLEIQYAVENVIKKRMPLQSLSFDENDL